MQKWMNTNYDMTTKLIPKDFLVTVMWEDSLTHTLIFWYLTTVEAWGQVPEKYHQKCTKREGTFYTKVGYIGLLIIRNPIAFKFYHFTIRWLWDFRMIYDCLVQSKSKRDCLNFSIITFTCNITLLSLLMHM